MRATTDLIKLGGVATRRIRMLRAEVVAVAKPNVKLQEMDRPVGRAAVEALNIWENFSRSYLLSYLGNPRRVGGQRVRLGNMSANSPGVLLHIAVKAVRGPTAPAPVDRRSEPKWHDTTNFLKACEALNPSNLAAVQAALSTQTRVFYDLPTFRNFYAHRNEESALKAVSLARRQYLISGVRHPTEALMRPAKKRPQALLLDWLDEMEIVVNFLCD